MKAKTLDIRKIDDSANAQRIKEADDGIGELANSIGRVGLIYPLLVREAGEFYEVVSGHRRFAAVKKLGWSVVRVRILEGAAEQDGEITIAENLFRRDLTPIELAAAVKSLVDSGTYTKEQIAEFMQRSVHWIDRQIQILAWPDDIIFAVQDGWLSVAAASNLALVEDDTYRDFLLRNAHDSGATARVTSAWLQAWRAMEPPEEAMEAPPEDAPQRQQPMVPQAPCMVCSNLFRTDQLSHVPVCGGCIQTIRDAVN